VILASLLLSGALLAQDGSFERDLASWRAAHSVDLLTPDGWLSLVGLDDLSGLRVGLAGVIFWWA
jgi:hypothetical protein